MADDIIAELKVKVVFANPEGTFVGAVDDIVGDGAACNILKNQDCITAAIKDVMIDVNALPLCPDASLNGRCVFFTDKIALAYLHIR